MSGSEESNLRELFEIGVLTAEELRAELASARDRDEDVSRTFQGHQARP
jgi:hypothetical protein